MECTALDILLATGRVSVLVLGMLGGMLCIYLGWRLYKDGIRSKSTGEFSVKEFKVALTASSPGIFLAFFGAYLMVAIVNRPFDMQDIIASPASKTSNLQTERFLRTVYQVEPNKQKEAAQPCVPCLIRERKRALSSGDTPLQPEEISAALSVASSLLEREMDSISDASKKREYRRLISVIDELRSSIAK